MDSPEGGPEWRQGCPCGTVALVPTSSTPPHTVDALLRVVQARDAVVAFLRLTVEKLTLQLFKARRSPFGNSSEQLDRQIALIECEPLDEQRAAAVAAKAAAICERADRRLPVHLPREEHFHHFWAAFTGFIFVAGTPVLQLALLRTAKLRGQYAAISATALATVTCCAAIAWASGAFDFW